MIGVMQASEMDDIRYPSMHGGLPPNPDVDPAKAMDDMM
jgi:hypothetical protein